MLERPLIYFQAAQMVDRELIKETTFRQFRTAYAICKTLEQQHGVLLADDVGLGKTKIGALVAWAGALSNSKVRILAPNKTIMGRWERELYSLIDPLGKCVVGGRIRPSDSRIKSFRSIHLLDGNIKITTHHLFNPTYQTDLLIVDEAHRARGEETNFRDRLDRAQPKAVLYLTATPFGINVDEMASILSQIETAPEVVCHIKHLREEIDEYWSGNPGKSNNDDNAPLQERAATLLDKVAEGRRLLKPYVIRHTIDDCGEEVTRFGSVSPKDSTSQIRADCPASTPLRQN